MVRQNGKHRLLWEKGLQVAKFWPMELFLAALAVVIAFIYLRNKDLYAVVFADEYVYSRLARLLPISDTPLPSYLYLATYRLTNFCGEGFLGCARLINIAFMAASIPFLFAVSARYTSKKISLVICITAIAGAINSFTVYFMPESMYFFGFWVEMFIVTRLTNASRSWGWLLAGAGLGALALIKPHALFLLPGLGVYISYLLRQNSILKWFLRAVQIEALFFCGFLAIKFGVGYMFAGRAALTLFGEIYAATGQQALNSSINLHFVGVAATSFLGHALALLVLSGTAIASGLGALLSFRYQRDAASRDLTLFAICVIAPLIVVAALFTASVAGQGPYESASRLHMRYYDFALPLLSLIAASTIGRVSSTSLTTRMAVSSALIIALAGALLITILHAPMWPFEPQFVDSPELRGLSASRAWFDLVVITSIAMLILWIKAPQLVARLFLLVLSPIVALSSTAFVTTDLLPRLTPDAYDRAGQFTHSYFSSEDFSSVVTVGDSEAGLLRAMFYQDSKNADADLVVADDKPVVFNDRFPGAKWLVAIGDYLPPLGTRLDLALDGFSIYRVVEPGTVDFREESREGVPSLRR